MLFHLEGLRTCVIRCIFPVHVVRRSSTEVITPSLVFNANSSRGGGQEYAGNRVRVAKILEWQGSQGDIASLEPAEAVTALAPVIRLGVGFRSLL